MNPTDEQALCVERYLAGESFPIEAGAGTGKTSTLRLLAEAEPYYTIQYLAFNKAIVTDVSGSFPRNVSARTIHSTAWQVYRPDYGDRLNATGRQAPREVARQLGVEPIMVPKLEGGTKRLSAGYLAGHVLKAIRNFCQTADPEPGEQHFSYIKGIDPVNAEGRRTYGTNRDVARALVPALHKAWADIRSMNGTLRFDHAHYLKFWQLDGAHIARDAVVVDEGQDCSPVMLDIVAQQGHAQRVIVGDSQQSIYGFTGAVNALQLAQQGGWLAEPSWLTQSFRFGPAIAGAANYILALLDAELRITGNPQLASTVGWIDAPDVLLTRTNSTALATLMEELKRQRTVHITGGVDDLVAFAKAAGQLKAQGWTSHPELACFSGWAEVQDYAAQDPLGDDLALMVKIVDEYGPDVVVACLQNMPPPHLADLVVTTTHKAKGLEWRHVKLAGDFPMPQPDKAFPDEEYRLLYVAATRAKLRLDPMNVPAFNAVRTTTP